MYYFIVTIIVIASVLITFAVLLQNSKGGGLAANFAAGNQTFGVRQTADLLEKATWILAIIIIACSILATTAISSKKSEQKVNVPELSKQLNKSAQPAFPIETTTNQEVEQNN